ncbi:MAG: sulfoxide reductase heme-binding subunit YedZ [Anaerolineaceae bacterium]|nr:sulfoxide reductase heme-binding subunit YedZ [Anaerolineaceae bacterium]
MAIHFASILPLIILIKDWFTKDLGGDPINEITHRTADIAIIILLASLTCTPLFKVFGFRQAIKVRRALGRYAFFYALLHFLTFLILDYGFDIRLVLVTITTAPRLILGSLAFLILFALAITSNVKTMKFLGKNWKRLHRFVYAAGILLVIHYFLAVKSDFRLPTVSAVILIILLLLRVPIVRNKIVLLRKR